MNQLSAYVPLVQLRGDAEALLRRSYVEPLVQRFFNQRNVTDPVEVRPEVSITELDFVRSKELPFTYFYDVAMRGARKGADGHIRHVAYTLTFDPGLCPHTCGGSGVRYGHLNLAGEPVLYYILLDLPKMIGLLRQHTGLAPGYGNREGTEGSTPR